MPDKQGMAGGAAADRLYLCWAVILVCNYITPPLFNQILNPCYMLKFRFLIFHLIEKQHQNLIFFFGLVFHVILGTNRVLLWVQGLCFAWCSLKIQQMKRNGAAVPCEAGSAGATTATMKQRVSEWVSARERGREDVEGDMENRKTITKIRLMTSAFEIIYRLPKIYVNIFLHMRRINLNHTNTHTPAQTYTHKHTHVISALRVYVCMPA